MGGKAFKMLSLSFDTIALYEAIQIISTYNEDEWCKGR